MMDRVFQDVRFGLRMLARRPGVSLAAVLALGLGIGANAGIFSVVNGVLLNPLPFPQPDRLVRVWEVNPKTGAEDNPVSPANFVDWRDQTGSFEKLTAIVNWQPNLGGTQSPERLRGSLVSWTFFSHLGAEFELGRSFGREDDQPDRGQVVVLSHRLWQRLFPGDADAVGKTLTLNGSPYVIAGVAEAGFRYPTDTELWAPLALSTNMLALRGGRFLQVLGRLREGVGREQAQAEMTAIARRLSQEHPKSNGGWGIRVVPLHEEIVGEVRPALLVLFATVAFVLLIACANVSNLLLARAASRGTEMAVRAGMGASRVRLVRLFLTETLIVALLGGGLGVAAAYGGLSWLAAVNPQQLPRLEEVSVDGRVLFFVLLITLVCALASGIVPALRASRPDLSQALREGGRGSAGGGQRLLRGLLVSQVAFALILLIGAGLMVKSFLQLMNVDLGFRTSDLLTLRISLPGRSYSQPERQLAFYDQLQERVTGLPGVQSSGLVSFLPLSGSSMNWVFSVQGAPLPEDERPQAQYRQVSDGYFDAIGMQLLQGRGFSTDDRAGRPVLIVNQAFALRYLNDGNPLDRRVGFGRQPSYRDVVGVVSDIHHFGPDREAQPEAYVPLHQDPWQSMAMVVRTAPSIPPTSIASSLRGIVRDIDPQQPIYDVQTMEQRFADNLASRRLAMTLMTGFAAIAVLLAGVGIYGVMAHSVNRRTREIGLRVALGARPGEVLRMVVWQGARLALMAVALGLAGALLLARFLSSLLYQVSPFDAAVYALVPLMLGGIVILACWVPAARASRVSPLDALRCE